MRFLVIVQDLRVSGTSEGIVSRSFIAKLRKTYPKSVIDSVYIAHSETEDRLDLLPVDTIKKHIVNTKVPFWTLFWNRFYWRLFHVSLKERYIHKQYAKVIELLDYTIYDHIFIRSAGIDHEMILATHNLPILKKTIINFHDPYPLSWYVGSKTNFSKLEFFRLKRMMQIVGQAKTCSSSAQWMSHDLEHLYASKKKFYTLPHQFDETVFDLSDKSQMLAKNKKISISYHGALMFGRNIENLLIAYQELLQEDVIYKENTEFVLRLKGDGIQQLKQKFSSIENLQILDCLNFSNSSNEQIHDSDIVIILENGPLYCNVLVGKAPFLAAFGKPVLCVSPKKSELREIITDKKFIANMNNVQEIKEKLKALIDHRMISNEKVNPFGDYFSDANFKKQLYKILNHLEDDK
ncbi:hypothetical protein J3S90_01735 [Flavobacterium sp. P4023]|uniref:Uncharacterized protein n=1 Tax=Flavobacterium flabelliforme TaxID=2816119 RepID=A0ABS5CPH3_9FLAO|nr:hypothetical protein [Flavobacterium flabelliforme]MBP4140519.1 hypothetical protein [Flavobacterium flabelliforme]